MIHIKPQQSTERQKIIGQIQELDDKLSNTVYEMLIKNSNDDKKKKQKNQKMIRIRHWLKGNPEDAGSVKEVIELASSG